MFPAVVWLFVGAGLQLVMIYMLITCFSVTLILHLATRRQSDVNGVGPAYDGSFGVDSEDILNSPNMDFGSVQYFPDQNNYGPTDPSLSSFDNIVAQGNAWFQQHAETAQECVYCLVLFDYI